MNGYNLVQSQVPNARGNRSTVFYNRLNLPSQNEEKNRARITALGILKMSRRYTVTANTARFKLIKIRWISIPSLRQE